MGRLRRLLSGTLPVAFLWLQPAPSAADPDRPKPGPPNVLIIVTDDQRADMLSVLSSVHWLFERAGATYERAYASTPLCCPARASILTGRYAHNHGVETNSLAKALDPDTTLGAGLKAAGYRTGLFGKLMNSWPLKKAPPHFDDYAVMRGVGGYYGTRFNVNGRTRRVDGYSTNFIGRRLRMFLRQTEYKDDRPWFAYVAPFAPHLPASASKAHRGAAVPSFAPARSVFEEDLSDKPPFVRSLPPPDRRQLSSIHGRMLRSLLAVDDLVWDTFALLARLREENTLAFFLSDNGFLLGEHRLLYKRVPYTESVQIPMFMRWPGRVPTARVSAPVLNIDIAATVYEATGAAPPAPLDGKSLLRTPNRPYAFLEGFNAGRYGIPPWRSFVAPGWQHIEYLDDAGEVAFREYYDLEQDPWQMESLPAPAGMTELLEAAATCIGAACP